MSRSAPPRCRNVAITRHLLWLASAVLPIALLSVIVSIWLASFVPADMVIPVRVYTLVISLMVIAAFGTHGAGAPLLVPIGALENALGLISVP